jgi:hypothetical protein
MCNLLQAITLCLLSAVSSQPAPVAIEPSAAPMTWELVFRFQDPQRVSVVVPGKAEPVVYWYMLYSVENLGEQEVDFYPEFELVTNTLKVVQSEIKVSPEAFRAVQRRADDPLLVTPERAIGKLLRGKDRARHSVALFRDFDPKTTSFTIFVGGLSGEVKRVKNPAFDEGKPESRTNERYFTFRKTLSIPFKFPGSETTRASVIPDRLADKQQWIMR